MTQPCAPDAVRLQIAALERRCRRWKALALLTFAGGLLSLSGGWSRSQQPDRIRPQAANTTPVDTSNLSPSYTNFCRVTGTPEELALDFGLNLQAAKGSEPVKLTHRVVMTFYTAKRLLAALDMSVRQHEKVYGPLELDFKKRMKNGENSGDAP